MNFTQDLSISQQRPQWPQHVPGIEISFLFISKTCSQSRTECSARSRKLTRMGHRCPSSCLCCHNCFSPQCGPDNYCCFRCIFRSWRPGIYFCHTLLRQKFHLKELDALVNVLSTIMLAASNYFMQYYMHHLARLLIMRNSTKMAWHWYT